MSERIQVHHDAAAFLAVARAALELAPALNNLALGTALRLARGAPPAPTPEPPCFFSVHDEAGACVGGAVFGGRGTLDLAQLPTDTAGALAIAVAREGVNLRAVIGPTAAAEAFTHAWPLLRSGHATLARRLRAFEASSVTDPARAPGHMRPATEADRALLQDWVVAFTRETALPDDHDPRQAADAMLDQQRAWVWDDGRAVALAVLGRDLGDGVSIGPVYTPPDARGHGYASSLVAQLAARKLATRRRYCCLFTDLANPLTDRLYLRLGFVAVGDLLDLRFS